MIFPYNGCFTLRSTSTVTVLSVLSETTVPTRMRLGIGASLSDSRGAGALGLQRLDLRDRPADFLDPRGALELVGRGLEAQVELLTLQLDELLAGLGPQVFELLLGHHSPPRCEVSPRRATTLVLIGSFIAARLNASAAR